MKKFGPTNSLVGTAWWGRNRAWIGKKDSEHKHLVVSFADQVLIPKT